jgi:hypothetical protein
MMQSIARPADVIAVWKGAPTSGDLVVDNYLRTGTNMQHQHMPYRSCSASQKQQFSQAQHKTSGDLLCYSLAT